MIKSKITRFLGKSPNQWLLDAIPDENAPSAMLLKIAAFAVLDKWVAEGGVEELKQIAKDLGEEAVEPMLSDLLYVVGLHTIELPAAAEALDKLCYSDLIQDYFQHMFDNEGGIAEPTEEQRKAITELHERADAIADLETEAAKTILAYSHLM